jgi:hypothetical protein
VLGWGEQKKGAKNVEAKLNEQIINLQYQIYYGNSKKVKPVVSVCAALAKCLTALLVVCVGGRTMRFLN